MITPQAPGAHVPALQGRVPGVRRAVEPERAGFARSCGLGVTVPGGGGAGSLSVALTSDNTRQLCILDLGSMLHAGSVNITDWRVLAVLLGFVLVLVFVATGNLDALVALIEAARSVTR